MRFIGNQFAALRVIKKSTIRYILYSSSEITIKIINKCPFLPLTPLFFFVSQEIRSLLSETTSKVKEYENSILYELFIQFHIKKAITEWFWELLWVGCGMKWTVLNDYLQEQYFYRVNFVGLVIDNEKTI